ncbi:NAD(P)/FAD-dependent oxidoreductase [Halobacterium salinarum]|uniref:NAD(P)/FAD-dependent oxidoreductase n=1 Tax=Halobacterium salinarum TaxID=2242 RepID=UPI0025573C68|nr:NAD(P)/FAD-dependent oxidoreductase [Halobacterium salinarum]MDL0120619.1 NAD(P)/FAD-dependent oxidoreductase [Halobacterium salinarum]
MTDEEAVVVGGGLAGLVAARHLAADGLDVTLFERNPTVGGRVRSTHADGFTFDRGFQVLFTSYPAAKRELDFDALDLRSFSPGAVICRGDRRAVLGDPLRDPGALVPSVLNREVSTMDKLRTLLLKRELTRKPFADIWSDADATIEQYLAARGFSDRYVDRFVRPFYGGITLDRSLSTSKRVFEYTFKLLADGRTVLPAAGMGAISAQLAARARDAGVTIEPETPVEAVHSDPAAVDVPGERIDADAVVVATDPDAARELTGVDAIPTDWKGCTTQHVALPAAHPLGDSDRIHLNAADDVPNTVAPMSGVAPEYAPDDRELVAVTTLGTPDRSSTALATAARDAIADWYPEASLGGFEVLHTHRVPFSQFAQPPGVHDTLPDTTAPAGAVYVAGSYTHNASINGAMESGRAAARAASDHVS